MPVCFQRNLVIFAKAGPTQMIFITTSNYVYVVGSEKRVISRAGRIVVLIAHIFKAVLATIFKPGAMILSSLLYTR